MQKLKYNSQSIHASALVTNDRAFTPLKINGYLFVFFDANRTILQITIEQIILFS